MTLGSEASSEGDSWDKEQRGKGVPVSLRCEVKEVI